MILTVTLTPALDKTVTIPGFALDRVNRVQEMRLDAGGKGINVSKSLRALGADSVAAGILGGGTGRFIREQLETAGIRCAFTEAPAETRTNLKIVDPQGGTHTDVNEAGAPVAPEVLARVLAQVEALTSPGDLVVLAGKAPPSAPEDLFARWCRQLKAKGVQVYLDADGALLREGVRACPTLIKPNDEELGRLVGHALDTPEALACAARELVAQGIPEVVVSMGGDGALFVTKDQVLRGHGLKVPVLSTVGAGDSMMAAMCLGAAQGLPWLERCRLAMAVSAATVSCPGTQPASREQVEALLPRVQLEEMSL